jgi:hypothetical protein
MCGHGDREIAGEYTAVVELATAMDKEFDKHEENLGVMRERQIQAKIKLDLKGGAMVYYAPLREYDSSFWVCLKRAVRKDKWWILAMVIGMVCTIVVGVVSGWGPGLGFVVFSSFVSTGILLARFVGVQKRSRRLMMVLFTLLGIVLAICVSQTE